MCSKQRFASGGTLSTAKILSTMSEIGDHLFATLEGHFAVNTGGERSSTGNGTLINEQQKVFCERIDNIITSLELSESSITEGQEWKHKCSCEPKVVVCSQISRYKSSIILLFFVLFLGLLSFQNSIALVQ